MKFRLIFLFYMLHVHLANVVICLNNDQIIEIKSQTHENLVLKSAFKYLNDGDLIKTKYNRIIWSFKRIYFNSIQFNSNDILIENEQMISIDNDVDEKLNVKYLIQNYDLIVKNLTYKDTGLYICNLWNQKKIVYKVVVFSDRPSYVPSINVINKGTNLKDKVSSFKENDNLILTCTSKYTYPFGKFKWYKNNVEMENVQIETELIDKETLTIESRLYLNNITSKYNSNLFKCKIYYDEVVLESNEEMLNVLFKPMIHVEIRGDEPSMHAYVINHESFNKKVNLFEQKSLNIKFKCKYEANPSAIDSIIWLKNGYLLHDDDSYTLVERDSLIIKEYDSQLKNLTCIVKNTIGQSQNTIEIAFMYEPKVSMEKTYYELDEHKQLQVQCKVVASPAVNEIIWKRLDNQHISSQSSLLEFKSLKRSDSGVYVCISKNYMIDIFNRSKIGYSEFNIEINVLFAPIMDSAIQLFKQALDSNQTDIKLNCLTSSNPEPMFNWYRLDPQSMMKHVKLTNVLTRTSLRSKNIYENTLVLRQETNNDLLGKYKCLVTNRLGQNEAIFEIVRQQLPDTPLDLSVVSINLTRILIKWQAAFDGGLKQTFQIAFNDYLINSTHSSTTNTLWLKNLSLNTLYRIKIRALNSLGASSWSNEIIANTPKIDMNTNIAHYLPRIDKIILNPSSNFIIKFDDSSKDTLLNVCIKIDTECYDLNINETITFIRLNNKLMQSISNKNKNNKLKGYLCLREVQSVCDLSNEIPIEILNNSKHMYEQSIISIELIISISICISILLLALLTTIIYFMRKNQLLNTNKKSGKFLNSICGKVFRIREFKKCHIDIAQISAPIRSSVSINCATTNSTVSSTSSSGSSKPLKVTDSNDYYEHKMNLFIIPPPPASHQHNLDQYSFSDLTHQQHTSMLVDAVYHVGNSNSSNSDPLVINNSISSSNTESQIVESCVDSSSSATYGYNVTNAYQTKNIQKTTVDTQASESGYSTPSRHKKVFYEVIV